MKTEDKFTKSINDRTINEGTKMTREEQLKELDTLKKLCKLMKSKWNK